MKAQIQTLSKANNVPGDLIKILVFPYFTSDEKPFSSINLFVPSLSDPGKFGQVYCDIILYLKLKEKKF